MSGRMTYGPRGSNHGTPISERDRVPGEMIGDWFHPYDGSAPTRITGSFEAETRVWRLANDLDPSDGEPR